MVFQTTFDMIYPIWAEHLWPTRVSNIESHSAMLLLGGIDIRNFNYKATYFFYMVDDIIAGCNSGHLCVDNTYRSRGLYVFPEYRNKGIGMRLLLATINQAKIEHANSIWSYPKEKAFSTYRNAGFTLVSDYEPSELGQNAYCKIIF
jgi:GNAT superfamily N-acetyltransferase